MNRSEQRKNNKYNRAKSITWEYLTRNKLVNTYQKTPLLTTVNYH